MDRGYFDIDSDWETAEGGNNIFMGGRIKSDRTKRVRKAIK